MLLNAKIKKKTAKKIQNKNHKFDFVNDQITFCA